jgi:hypothetical protein
MISALYLFNPFSIASCVGMSTSVFGASAILCMIYFGLSGNLILSCLFCGISAYNCFYPIIMCIPLGLLVQRCRKVLLVIVYDIIQHIIMTYISLLVSLLN